MRLFILLVLLMTEIAYGSASSPLQNKVKEDEIYITINSSNNQSVSATKWVENTANDLIQYPPFQALVEEKLLALVDDPSTPWVDAFIDESVELPLIGEQDIGLHVQDLWGPTVGPTRYLDTTKVSARFNDTDTKPIKIDWGATNVIISRISSAADSYNLPDGTMLPRHSGQLDMFVTLGAVEVDIVLRKPEYPKHITTSEYVHAAGKLRITGITLYVSAYTTGGKWGGSNSLKGGYGVGFDIPDIVFTGGAIFDLDEFDCSYNQGNTIGLQYRDDTYGVCFVYADGKWELDPTHPDRALGGTTAQIATRHQNSTNQSSDYLTNLIQFMEGQIYVGMHENSIPLSAQAYLAPVEFTDTTWLTHTRSVESITDNLTFGHPLGGTVHNDYAFMWRSVSYNDAFMLQGGATYNFINTDPPCVIPLNGATAWTVPHGKVNRQTLGNSPMIGVGVHVNVLNEAIHSAWSSGVLCIDLNKDTPIVGSQVESILNDDNFRSLLPSLIEDKGNITVKMRPSFTTNATYYAPKDQPRVIMDPQTNPKVGSKSIYDIDVLLPHYEFTFASDIDGNKAYTDIFSIDVSSHVYADLSWYKINGGTGTYCDNPPYPCRMARFAFAYDPTVVTVTESSLRHLQVNPATLARGISNLVSMSLSGAYSLDLSLAVNTDPSNATFLGIIIDPSIGSGINQGIVAYDADNNGTKDYYAAHFRIADMNGDGRADTLDPSVIMQILETSIFQSPKYMTDNDAKGTELEFMHIGDKLYLDKERLVQYNIDGIVSLPMLTDTIDLGTRGIGDHTIHIWTIDDGYINLKPKTYRYTEEPLKKSVDYSDSFDGEGCSTTRVDQWPLGFFLLLFVVAIILT